MRAKGAYEVGASHYKWMLLLHVSFFCSLLLEVTYFSPSVTPHYALLGMFLLLQVVRIWCLASLGTFWNTKIIILPGVKLVAKGPYAYMRHPNYAVVCVEILLLPLLFQAYATAICFTILNAVMLSVRIPVEESALRGVASCDTE